jgi:outer membrane immunogenic protein
MKHLSLYASSVVIALAAGPTLASGAVITGATPAPEQALLPDASLRPSFAPLSSPFGPSPFAAAPSSWTGPYFGVNAGYIMDGGGDVNIGAFPLGNGLYPSDTAVISGNFAPNGASFIGGGEFGYNYQFANVLFAGLETDIQGSALKGSSSLANTAPYGGIPGFVTELGAVTATKSLSYLGTLRARFGFLVTPAIGAYATAGLAYGHVGLNTSSMSGLIFNPSGAAVGAALGATSYSGTRAGWTAGAGLEAFLSPNWSAKIEYLYYDLGATSGYSPFVAAFSIAPGSLDTIMGSRASTSFYGHIARLGVNYHLSYAPAPIIAKY